MKIQKVRPEIKRDSKVESVYGGNGGSRVVLDRLEDRIEQEQRSTMTW